MSRHQGGYSDVPQGQGQYDGGYGQSYNGGGNSSGGYGGGGGYNDDPQYKSGPINDGCESCRVLLSRLPVAKR